MIVAYLASPFAVHGCGIEFAYAHMRSRVAVSRHVSSWLISRYGMAVINPLAESDGIETTLSGSAWLRLDLALLRAADILVLSHGWRNSHGCRVEYRYARFLGKAIYEENGHDLVEVHHARAAQ